MTLTQQPGLPALVSLPSEILILIANNIEEPSLLGYRFTCKELCQSAKPAFLRANFFTRRLLPIRSSLQRLLDLLKHEDFGPHIKKIVLNSIPDNYDERNREKDQYFIFQDDCFKQIFHEIKTRGNAVALEIIDSDNTCNYLDLGSNGLTQEVQLQAAAVDYEITSICVTTTGDCKTLIAGVESTLWRYAQRHADRCATSYTRPISGVGHRVNYTPHDKALYFSSASMICDDFENWILRHTALRSSIARWVFGPLGGFAITKLHLFACTIHGPGVLRDLFAKNSASLQVVILEEVRMQLWKHEYLEHAGETWYYWGNFLRMFLGLSSLRHIKLSALRYLCIDPEQLDTWRDVVTFSGNVEEIEVKGDEFKAKLEDIASYVMSTDENMREKMQRRDIEMEEGENWQG